ncbi:glycoside hydrolase family 16 protein [Sphingobacterium chuzhouense]|uniref:Glycoside hydrolase family 16 protein n=1 Tax=Sphingobacterium chuzhouense TaxID=1742264 RepID=A0ABR7XXE8_9SPHI|nr:glycoside hydrolase family 16 protein [Sphingobacterium chuzhouense]MBD1423735.1 glycoside hydrolase family 16 protein [Sphingobacterium chuzhouense]
MKKLSFFTFIWSICILYSCGKSSESNPFEKNFPTESITPSGIEWELDASKSDEFDRFDSDKWTAEPLWYWGGVSAHFAYRRENTEVRDGIARLFAKKEDYANHPDAAKHYTAGCLKSKFEVGGDTYIEVRAKMIHAPANVCAAIWLGDDPVESKNPNIEIDMQETKSARNKPHLLNTSLLTWPKPGNGNTVPGYTNYYFPWGLDEDFHLYGLERRDGKLKFYLDGMQYWEWDTAETPAFVTQLRPIILSIEGHAGAPGDADLPADFQIDWVRVFNVKK